MNDAETEHFLIRRHTIRRLWWVFSVVLVLTVLSQAAFQVKGYYMVDGWFGFGAVYGFLCCLVMVLFARALGTVLKRPQHYYHEREDDA